MGENIQGLLNKIKSWLWEPEVRSCTCAVSSVVGLLCFALSSSFNDLFGKWSWWKIVIYFAFSFIVCCFTWFSNERLRSTFHRWEVCATLVLLMLTNVYSFVFDEKVKKKPDAYILISYAAFAIMSLSLCPLGPLGTDLLYFFCGLLSIQLMKINIWLVIVAGIFSCSLIILSSREDAESQVQDVESGFRQPLTNSSVSPVDSYQANINWNHNAQLQADPIAEDDGEEEDISASDSDHHPLDQDQDLESGSHYVQVDPLQPPPSPSPPLELQPPPLPSRPPRPPLPPPSPKMQLDWQLQEKILRLMQEQLLLERLLERLRQRRRSLQSPQQLQLSSLEMQQLLLLQFDRLLQGVPQKLEEQNELQQKHLPSLKQPPLPPPLQPQQWQTRQLRQRNRRQRLQ